MTLAKAVDTTKAWQVTAIATVNIPVVDAGTIRFTADSSCDEHFITDARVYS